MSEHTRDQLLEELQLSQQRVIRLLEVMAHDQDWQPEPVEWSFRYIAAHLATVEKKCHLRRIRRIASGEQPSFSPYTNVGAEFGQFDLHDSLRDWINTRQELIEFVRELSDHALHFTGMQEDVGRITLLDALEEILEQDQGNLRHVCRLIIDYYEEML